MDKRVLREHGGAVCKQGNDSKIHTKSGKERERLREDIGQSTGVGFQIEGKDLEIKTIPRPLGRGSHTAEKK